MNGDWTILNAFLQELHSEFSNEEINKTRINEKYKVNKLG